MDSISLPSSLPATSRPSAAVRPALARVLHTSADGVPTLARIILGLVLLPHGAQKLLGWFGGYGFTGTMQWFTDTMHFPWLLGFAAIVAETVGGLALVAGLFTRVAAAATAVVFATAVATVHARHGFFMNWFGQQQGEGYEYFLLGGALALIVVLRGGGAASVDLALSRRGPLRPR